MSFYPHPRGDALINLFLIDSHSFATKPSCLQRHLLIAVSRNAHYPPHSHAMLTTHLIRGGEMTVAYPREQGNKKETFGVGARVDVEAGRVHEVWMGREGCEYVIGEM